MQAIDIPLFGNVILCAIMVAAAYTFGLSVAAGRGRPHLLPAARWGTLATCALVLLAVLTLAYAFQTHDFRIRYVSRYSDRSMPWWYLVTALWGGQDGSLLWWTLILSAYTSVCVAWMRGKYPELQPWVLATLMSIYLFFTTLMLFAANPFALNLGGAPPDGEGLNPLLQNYWMIIHPPMLYSGLVGWSIPFGFVVAALVTGRLNEEWIHASRRWVLFAWLALSVGNMLGALWSYEELGWGGYWAWDPVENASFMPWLLATAFLHSVMIQERRGMMKVWNVALLCATFFLTIFGTFLTRSGLIASVHSFARSDIGYYFLPYLGLLIVGCSALIVYRLPRLRSEGSLDSVLSREFAFTINNWILLLMLVFVFGATTYPLFSEWVRGETVTVGPAFYNKWMVPMGLVLLFLTGVGPLIAWRKASGKNLAQAFIVPVSVALVMFLLHLFGGTAAGYPPFVDSQGQALYDTWVGRVLAYLYGVMPLAATTLCAFVTACIVQEYVRGTRARMRSAKESLPIALFEVVTRAKRRYGGYIVHIAVVMLFLGVTGAAYDQETESAVRPGQSMSLAGYTIRYDGPRLESDPNKRMLMADLTLIRDGHTVGRMAPAKYIYRVLPDMPTTEVSIRSTVGHDLYVIMNSVNPETRVATLKAIYRPMVSWIWVGGLVLIFGTFVSISPALKDLLADAPSRAPARAAVAAVLLAASALFAAAPAHAQDSSSLHAGNVTIHDAAERRVFERLLCMCGDCQRLPLSTCACGWADDARAQLRARLEAGETPEQIERSYRALHGAIAIAVPSDHGMDRLLWAIPMGGAVLAAVGLGALGVRWARQGRTDARGRAASPAAAAPTEATQDASLDAKLEDELRKLED